MKGVLWPLTLGWLGCFLAVAPVKSSQACDLCADYRPMEEKSNHPGFHLGFFEQYTHFGALQQDGDEVSDPAGQDPDRSITRVIIGYQVNDRFGVQLNIPSIHRSFKRPEGFEIDQGIVAGLGDLTLVGHLRAHRRITANNLLVWDLLGGVKLPTGSSERLKEKLAGADPLPGVPESWIHCRDLALAIGSYDAILGTGIFANWQRLFLSGGAQYAIRSRGGIEHRYANDLSWHVKPGGYLWLAHGTLGLVLSVTGEHKGKEKPSAELGVDLPVVMDNTALQLVPDYRVRAALTWRL